MTLPEKLQALIHAEAERLPLWLPVALMLGIAIYFAQPAPMPLYAPLAALLPPLGYVLLGRRLWVRWGMVFACMVLLGMAASAYRLERIAAPILHASSYGLVEGTVAEAHTQPKKRVKLVLNPISIEGVPKNALPKLVRVSVRQVFPPFALGERVRMKARLFPPGRPSWPGGYDFGRFFYFKQIGGLGYVMGKVERLEAALSPEKSRWHNMQYAARQHVGETVRTALKGDVGAVTAALMNGEKSPIGDATQENMRQTGLAHILSISGLHLTLVAGLAFIVLRLLALLIPIFRHRGWSKVVASLGALIVAFIYLALADFPVAAQRAFIMVAFFLLAIMLGRQVAPLRSLGMAAFVILLIWPESIFSISFILSFAATLAILTLVDDVSTRVRHFLDRGGELWRKPSIYISGVLGTSLVASLATMPFVMDQFQQINLYSVPANMLTSALVSFWIMPCVMLALILMPLGVAGPVLWLAGVGVEYMLKAAAWVATWPHVTLHAFPMTKAGFVLCVVGGLWLCLMHTRIRWVGLPLIILGMITSLQHPLPDVFIAGDARLVIIKDAKGDYAVAGGFEDHREAKYWLEFVGQEEWPDLYDAAQNETTHHWKCSKAGCDITLHSQRMWLQRKKGKAECPAGKDIAIFMRGEAPKGCRARALVLDVPTLKAQGGTWLSFEGGEWKMQTVNASISESGGQWPWQPRLP